MIRAYTHMILHVRIHIPAHVFVWTLMWVFNVSIYIDICMHTYNCIPDLRLAASTKPDRLRPTATLRGDVPISGFIRLSARGFYMRATVSILNGRTMLRICANMWPSGAHVGEG